MSSDDRLPTPKVLFIGGNGRTGSTLLDRMLGQIPGFCSVGELRHIWRRGLLENRLCGCGTAFRLCPFWSRVGLEAFGGWRAAPLGDMLRLEQTVARHRFVPLMLLPRVWPNYERELHRYATRLSRLYGAIRCVGSADMIIDSSKDPSHGFLLRRVPGLDLRVLHLVRDSRGIAYSWTKQVSNPDVTEAVKYLPRFHPSTIAFRWMSHNLLMESLERLVSLSTRVRYEDLVISPQVELRRILTAVGGPAQPDLTFLGSREVSLGISHTVSGNPMRMSSGRLSLRLDDEWRARMPTPHRRLVTMLTWPYLMKYGYLRATDSAGS